MGSTVLIADDDPVQRRLLEAMVRRFGYHARLVDGGEAALRELEAGAVDLLILDLVMPDLDGIGMLGRMRQGHRCAGDRADPAWFDRRGDLGDAGRCC